MQRLEYDYNRGRVDSIAARVHGGDPFVTVYVYLSCGSCKLFRTTDKPLNYTITGGFIPRDAEHFLVIVRDSLRPIEKAWLTRWMGA